MGLDAWTEDRLDELANYWDLKVVIESAALDVYGPLAAGPLSAKELAARLDLEPRAAGLFFDALTALGLLRRDGDRYSNSESAQRYLVPASPEYRGHRLLVARDNWEMWGRLSEALRTGSRQRTTQMFREDREASRRLLLAIHRNALDRAAEILESEAISLSGRRKLLDVGGGAGSYSIAFCSAHPELKATLADRPIAAELARELVADAGLADRITIEEMDFDEVRPSGRYDFVWVSNVLHSRSASANRRLFEQLGACLEPGGELAVQDLIMDEQHTAPARGAVFSIHMLLSNGVGRCYTFAEIKDWLEGAGLRDIRWVREGEDLTLATGKR